MLGRKDALRESIYFPVINGWMEIEFICVGPPLIELAKKMKSMHLSSALRLSKSFQKLSSTISSFEYSVTASWIDVHLPGL